MYVFSDYDNNDNRGNGTPSIMKVITPHEDDGA